MERRFFPDRRILKKWGSSDFHFQFCEDTVMDKLKDLYNQYWDQIITWYSGLEILYQYGVLFALFVIGLFIVFGLIVSRITK